jgi:hypothetical protein
LDLVSKKEIKLIDNAFPIGLLGNDELLVGLFRGCKLMDGCMFPKIGKEIYEYKIVKAGIVSDTKLFESLKAIKRNDNNNYADTIRQVVTGYQQNDNIGRVNMFYEN